MKTITIFLIIILKVCLCCDKIKELSFVDPFKNVLMIQVSMGENLTLICCHPDGAENLLWRDKDNNEIDFKNRNGVFTLKDEKNRLILRIDNIDSNKLGDYTCMNPSRILFKSVTVSTIGRTLKPKINKNDLFFPNNKPILFQCLLKSNQIFKSWRFKRGNRDVIVYKDGQGKGYEVSEDKTIFKVIFDEKEKNISRVWCQYQEVADNGDVRTILNEYTWTLYEPIHLKLIKHTKDPILESQDVSITCYFNYNEMISVSFPNNVILKPNMLVNNNNLTKGSVALTIKKITKDLEGDYECKITKFINTEPFQTIEESAKVKVVLRTPPIIIRNDFMPALVRLNDDVSLNCHVKSNNLLENNVYFELYNRNTSSWTRLYSNEKYSTNFILNDTSVLTLIIKKVTWEDRGKYRCVASNIAGKDKKICQINVEKAPELITNDAIIYMATKPVKVVCSVSGYPLSPSDDKVELKILSKSSSLELNLIDKQKYDSDGLSAEYEVVHKGEMFEGSSFKLQCYYQNLRTKSVQQKDIELQFAQKPNVPEVEVLCSGSSGIAFKYKIISSDNNVKRIIRHMLSYAPSENFDSLSKRPSNVLLNKVDEKNEYMIYVLKDLMVFRNYTIKWESFNMFSLSNELTLKYKTKNMMPPNKPKKMEFSTIDNKINANVILDDECPYIGANSDIQDIIVDLRSLKSEEGKPSNWQWTEKNFNLDIEKSSVQFTISLNNPQIDYEIKIALRSFQGTSDSLTAIYKADVVLTGSLFACFPRCSGNVFSYSFLFLILVSTVILLKHYN